MVEKWELIYIDSTSDSAMTFLDFSTLEKLESVIQIDASIPLEPVIYSGALFTLQFPSMHLHPVGITHSIFDTVDSTPCVILTKSVLTGLVPQLPHLLNEDYSPASEGCRE